MPVPRIVWLPIAPGTPAASARRRIIRQASTRLSRLLLTAYFFSNVLGTLNSKTIMAASICRSSPFNAPRRENGRTFSSWSGGPMRSWPHRNLDPYPICQRTHSLSHRREPFSPIRSTSSIIYLAIANNDPAQKSLDQHTSRTSGCQSDLSRSQHGYFFAGTVSRDVFDGVLVLMKT